MKRLIDFSSRFRILKGGKISLVVSAFLASSTLSFASPTGADVVSGSATINTSGNITNINQSTQKASINWQNFSISSNETVNFNQPNSSSITLNRVIGNETSIIDGALNANGQVWILNSNGILFNDNAKINTAGLLATTKNLSDEDFNAGNYNFSGDSTASVINKGTIEVVDSSYVVFASNEVKNEGTIKAVKGTIHLVGADEVSLNLNGNSLLDLTVNKGVLDALVENTGTIVSDGGSIYLTTNAVDELLKGVVNNTGVIEANSIDDLTGHVELFAHGGTANISGNINATDGFVETSGKNVKIDDSFRVKADTWLIDPTDFTIAASGGDMTGTALSTNLENTDVTIQSTSGATDGNGNIYVNDTVSWNANQKLTLDAYNDIFINSSITATFGQLALSYGQGAVNANNASEYHVNAKVNLSAGDNFFTKLGNDGTQTTWTVITSLGSEGSRTGTDLQGINRYLTANYVLGADIDASDTTSWNTGTGWDSIGDSSHKFSGNFDGLGHTISNLYQRIDTQDAYYFGMFEGLTNATIKNVKLDNFYIEGKNSNPSATSFTGILAGNIYKSTVKNIFVSNSIVKGGQHVGGLVGTTNVGTISNVAVVDSNAYASSLYVGGLAGIAEGGSIIENSYFTGNVTGDSSSIGGLVGQLDVGQINNSYTSSTITSSQNNTGGLVGYLRTGIVANSYYDKEKNTLDNMSDLDSGKTKTEIVSALSPLEAWTTGSGNSVKGYSTATPLELPQLVTFYTSNSETLFASGFGTESNPYTITNWTQLQNINYNSDTITGGYYYTLSNDLLDSTDGYITLASSTANSGAGWTAIGNNTNNFTGTFDGDNHTIDKLYISNSLAYKGLFGVTASGTVIQNLGVTNVDITNDNAFTGALVGNNSGSISNSYSTGSVIGNEGTGGLVGKNSGSISNSYSTGSVKGKEGTGGLVGENFSLIENSYSSSTVTMHPNTINTNVRGLVGGNYDTITNSYYDNETNTAYMNDSTDYGRTKAQIVTALSNLESWTTGSSGDSIEGYSTEAPLELPELVTFYTPDENAQTLFNSGYGTMENPYTITNWNQLQNINYNSEVLSGGYYYNLSNDLLNTTDGYTTQVKDGDILANNGTGWNPIGGVDDSTYFIGFFDGRGHTIDSLAINAQRNNVALFGYIGNNGTVANLGVTNVDIHNDGVNTGALSAVNQGRISNSYVTGNIFSEQYKVGGIASNVYWGSVANSYSLANTSGSSDVGTLVGNIYNGSVTNSYGSYNNINTVYNGTITDVSNAVKVTKEELRNLTVKSWSNNFWSVAAGGANVEGYEITELPYLSVTKEEDKLATTTLFESGMGIDGNAYSITNWNQLQNINYNTTTLASYFTLSNNLDATTDGYTTQVKDGDVLANNGKGWNTLGDTDNTSLLFTGTFDGQNHTIDSLEIDGSQLVGQGLFGAITSTATVKNIGLTNVNIKAGDLTGGLVGSNDGTIINAYTTGNVSASNSQAYVGGLVGQNINNGSVSNSYSLASVSSSDSSAYIGGLSGVNFATISDSYFAGNLSGEAGSSLGGLVGYGSSSSDIQKSFYKITSSEADNNQGTGVNSNLISYGQIYKDAGWDIRVDNTLTSLTPVRKYDEANSIYYWAIAPKTVNYTLSNEEYTYDGTNKILSDIYTTSSIFGDDYVSQDTATATSTTIDYLDGSYKFQVNSEDVTLYKNAGTYENIKVVSTNDFLNIATTQNTDGKIVINQKTLSINGATVDDKTYDGTTDAIVSNYGSVETGITGETISLDTTNVSGIFSDKNAGTDKTVTVSGYTLSDTDTASASNYALTSNSIQTIASIDKKDITVTANDQEKTQGNENPELTYETVGMVSGDLLNGGLLTEVEKDTIAGEYDILQGDLSSNNYNITFEKGMFTVKNNDVKKVIDSIVKLPTRLEKPKVENKAPLNTPQTTQVQTEATIQKTVVATKSKDTDDIERIEIKQNNQTIAMSPDSLVLLLDGGVKLPEGVSQEYYAVKKREQR